MLEPRAASRPRLGQVVRCSSADLACPWTFERPYTEGRKSMTKYAGSLLMGIMFLGATVAGCEKETPSSTGTESSAGTEVSTRSATPGATATHDVSHSAGPAPEGETKKGAAAAKAANVAPEIAAVLDGYERVRAALAQDDLAKLPSLANDLQGAASSASEDASAALRTHLRVAASATKAMSAAGADAAAARKAFGEVSQAVVALLEADPKLAEGRHLFECPMASGYKKWVQTNDEISNPYMGKAMPKCGVTAEW